MKAALGHMDPWLIVFCRMVLATAAFAFFWRRLPPPASIRRHLPRLLLMALSEPCLYFVFEARALTLTPASQAGVITALLPVMVACAAGLFQGERTGWAGWTGLGLGITGAVLLSAGGQAAAGSPNPALGNLLELLAMACATVYTLTIKTLVRHFAPLFLTAFQVVTGLVFFVPTLFFSPFPQNLPWQTVAAVVYLGLGVSVVAYGLYNFCLTRLPASRVAGAVNLIPAFTLLLGWLLLGETIQGLQWLGIAFILAGARLSASSP